MKVYFEESYSIDFDSYPITIEDHLKSFVDSRILDSKFSDIYISGRKAMNLFQPYIRKTERDNKLQGIYSIQLFSDSEIPIIRVHHINRFSNSPIIRGLQKIRKKFGKAIIVTDAIRSGTEVREIIGIIGYENISKVCGYLANKKTLENLEWTYPKIQFSFIHPVDQIDYDDEHDKLQYIYQSRLIPFDADHTFRIFSVTSNMSESDLFFNVKSALDGFISTDAEIVKDNNIVPYIISGSIDLDYNKNLKEKIPNNGIFDIERSQFRFKYNPYSSKIMIKVFALCVLISPEKIKYNNCSFDISKKHCKTIFIPKDTKENPVFKICPLCIDKNISEFILSNFERKFVERLNSTKIGIQKLQFD